MKKILNLMMALTVAFLATGLASCSKDDDGSDEGTSNGKMTGWVKIGDNKYNLKYCWDMPDEDANDNSWSILAASKNIDTQKLIKDNFDVCTITIKQRSNGTWEYDIEFITDFNYFDDSKITGYMFDGTDAVIEKVGDSFLIQAENVTMERYDADDNVTGTVTGSFYFNGKPATLKNTSIG